MFQRILNPGATIGILGGGQLGKMTAEAAIKAGYKVIVFAPSGDNPAFLVPDIETIEADYGDEKALEKFGERCDVITLEFENIPVNTLAFLEKLTPVRPGPKVLRIAQDRRNEKKMFQELKLPTPSFIVVEEGTSLPKELPFRPPAVCKTCTLGYDGKGQAMVTDWKNLAAAWQSLAGRHCLLEEKVELRCELSVIVARNDLGEMTYLGPFENRHENGILRETIYPARNIDGPTTIRAIQVAEKIANYLSVCGLVTVEMFVTRFGHILVNEIAPRPHNSGHLSIEAFGLSQFGLLVKAICNQPLPEPSFLHRSARMVNLLGDERVDSLPWNTRELNYVHTYGKREVRPGRKMGHVTFINPIT